MAKKRVQVTISFHAEVDELEVRSRVLGSFGLNPDVDDEELVQEELDQAATEIAGNLASSLHYLIFRGAPWRVIATSVPTLDVLPFTARVTVRE